VTAGYWLMCRGGQKIGEVLSVRANESQKGVNSTTTTRRCPKRFLNKKTLGERGGLRQTMSKKQNDPLQVEKGFIGGGTGKRRKRYNGSGGGGGGGGM